MGAGVLVQVGQVWTSNDPRRQNTTLTVTGVFEASGRVEAVSECKGKERRVRVKLAKFSDPTTHGYRLLKPAAETKAEEPATNGTKSTAFDGSEHASVPEETGASVA